MKRTLSSVKLRRAPRPRHVTGLLTLSQLATASGESVHALRYYLREGLLKPRQVAANGYRLFDQATQARLRFVRRAQRLGFSLAEIRSFIHDARRGQTPCPRVREILEQRLPVIGTQLTEMVQLHERMKRAADSWRQCADALPTGDEVCRLIEGVPDQ